ncbi:MAG: hypothetical protein LPK00_06235 [Bacillaceae bacterium]|nr:hypothetical protein [Bacillaceae bacterium]
MKKVVILLFLLSFLTVCSQINENKAIEISLEEAQIFKPEHSKFEVYKVEESSRGWVVMISSLDPVFDKTTPNIIIDVSKRGRIIKIENLALTE